MLCVSFRILFDGIRRIGREGVREEIEVHIMIMKMRIFALALENKPV